MFIDTIDEVVSARWRLARTLYDALAAGATERALADVTRLTVDEVTTLVAEFRNS
jgi:hypothetical protein